jgi:site-specific DNA-methyltransferase (adenine-specific)
MNRLFFGDNLGWLRDTKEFPDASVDLVYLDPPFNSNADYNVLFREESGEASQAQFHAFTDTWTWADAAETYNQFIDACPNLAVVEMMEAFHSFLKNSPMMAYLAMMAPRLVELHRVLKPTGSLYLHCDPTASHYLRILLDGIFGAENFCNEIIWRRTGSHNSSRRLGPIHDTIFFYSKTDEYLFNRAYRPYLQGHVNAYFKQQDAKGKFWTNALTGAGIRHGESGKPWKGFDPTSVGRHWALPGRVIRELGIDEGLSVQEKLDALDEAGFIGKTQIGSRAMPTYKQYLNQSPGIPLQDIWAYQPYTQGLLANSEEAIDEDVRWLVAQGDTERMGYATQKPQGLLERILTASSRPDDVVLDPFCGCGTTVHAAQKLGRQWIGIDVTYLAINLIKRRLKDAFGEELQFEEKGQPTDFESAKRLAELDKFQFQHWALSLIDARPLKEGDGKGADRGVDGLLYFYESKDERRKIIVQVKGGGVKRGDVATLLGDVNNQKAAGGILLTLEKPTGPMRDEAADAGRYESKLWHDKDYPKIQILTIEGLLGKTQRVDAPPQMNPFAKAKREATPGKQADLI